jgi:hypothetical protein
MAQGTPGEPYHYTGPIPSTLDNYIEKNAVRI